MQTIVAVDESREPATPQQKKRKQKRRQAVEQLLVEVPEEEQQQSGRKPAGGKGEIGEKTEGTGGKEGTGQHLEEKAQLRQIGPTTDQMSQIKRMAKLTGEEKGQLEALEGQMVELLGRIDTERREAEQNERQSATSSRRPTTTVQMGKNDSPSDELANFPRALVASNISPPLMNEAECLRQSFVLMEEAELAKRENEKRERAEWEQWLREKESQLGLTEHCVPADLDSLSAQLENCDKMFAQFGRRLSESDAEMVEPIKKLQRTAETKRNHCMDSINKTQLAIHKAVEEEETGDEFRRELEDWIRRNSEETLPRDTEEKVLKMQPHDEAARRERQRAAEMRRWPSSLFLADEQHFHILESPELNQCEFSEAVLRVLNHTIMFDENAATAGAIRRFGRMFVGRVEMMRGEMVGPSLMTFLQQLNFHFRNTTDFVGLAVWAHYEFCVNTEAKMFSGWESPLALAVHNYAIQQQRTS